MINDPYAGKDELLRQDRAEVIAHLRSYSVKVARPGEEFTLASGGKSRLYVDAKKTTQHRKMHHPIARLIRREVKYLGDADVLAGVVLGGAHLASIAASVTETASTLDESAYSVAFVRRKEKDHGTRNLVESPWVARYGELCVVIEDVLSTGASVTNAIHALRDDLYKVVGVVALLDRRSEDDRTDEIEGVRLRSIFTAFHLELPTDIARVTKP